jgi:hypothetical protein
MSAEDGARDGTEITHPEEGELLNRDERDELEGLADSRDDALADAAEIALKLDDGEKPTREDWNQIKNA